jgi:hypothetical protein
VHLDKDAFSTGQVLSKIWLAEQLERVVDYQDVLEPLDVLIMGGWYGLLNFILRTRARLRINSVRSIDIDNEACEIADLINKAWVWQNWQFKSVCEDANTFQYTAKEFNLVINTSVEHIPGQQWFKNIPKGTLVAIQSNDMTHDDHCHNHTSLEHFIEDFKLSTAKLIINKLKEWCLEYGQIYVKSMNKEKDLKYESILKNKYFSFTTLLNF